MSVLYPAGGLVPGTETQFFGPAGSPCSLSLRIINSSDAVAYYTMRIGGNAGTAIFAGDRAYGLEIPVGGYVDLDKDLQVPVGAELFHTSNPNAVLYYSLTGVVEDGN